MAVLLVAQLDELGHVSNAMVMWSSGLRELDRAAFTAVDQWRFDPVVVEGVALHARVRVRLTFAPTAEAPPGSIAAPICRNWSYAMALAAGIPTLGANSAKPFKTVAAQSLAGLTPCATMPKASGLAIISTVVSWHLVAARVSLGVPPEKGGAGLENPSMYQMYALAGRRHFSVAPAGNPFAFYGGRCVGIFGSAGLVHTGFRARTVRHLYRWRCCLSCTEHCHEHIGLPFPARAVRSGQR